MIHTYPAGRLPTRSPCLLHVLRSTNGRSLPYTIGTTTASGTIKGQLLHTRDSSTTTRRRELHSSSSRSSPPTVSEPFPLPAASSPGLESIKIPKKQDAMARRSPLSVLPISTILRTLMTTTISSSPVLLPRSLRIMSVMAHSNNPILNPDKNPLLRWFLKRTFYAQFCAGENSFEVRATVDGLKKVGFDGVILCYAREVVLSKEQQVSLSSASCSEGTDTYEACIRDEIIPWKKGTMETVELARPGDFVAIKLTGAGRQALYALQNRLPLPRYLAAALDEICSLAAQRGVPLLVDAEQIALQPGIDDWTLQYQRRFNKTPGKAVVYGTYQAYLKSAPATLTNHLEVANRENFTLGVKIVRGAYLDRDREFIHDTKEDTDAAFNDMTSSLIRRQWGTNLVPSASSNSSKETEMPAFPEVSIVVGSHNLESVRRARALRSSPEAADTELAIAQLQGMADEVSCDLLCALRGEKEAQAQTLETSQQEEKHQLTTARSPPGLTQAIAQTGSTTTTRVHKYIPWGSAKECLGYLLRRAEENKDAATRTQESRDAMWAEVKRRGWAKVWPSEQ